MLNEIGRHFGTYSSSPISALLSILIPIPVSRWVDASVTCIEFVKSTVKCSKSTPSNTFTVRSVKRTDGRRELSLSWAWLLKPQSNLVLSTKKWSGKTQDTLIATMLESMYSRWYPEWLFSNCSHYSAQSRGCRKQRRNKTLTTTLARRKLDV